MAFFRLKMKIENWIILNGKPIDKKRFFFIYLTCEVKNDKNKAIKKFISFVGVKKDYEILCGCGCSRVL